MSQCQVSWNTQAIFPRQIATSSASWVKGAPKLNSDNNDDLAIQFKVWGAQKHWSSSFETQSKCAFLLGMQICSLPGSSLTSILTAAALRRQEGLDESLPSLLVAANCIHQTQYAGETLGSGVRTQVFMLCCLQTTKSPSQPDLLGRI